MGVCCVALLSLLCTLTPVCVKGVCVCACVIASVHACLCFFFLSSPLTSFLLNADEDLVSMVLVMHASFVSSIELANTLMQRYTALLEYVNDAGEMKNWAQRVRFCLSLCMCVCLCK